MNCPLVSVIIVVFNAEKTIGLSLDSVLSQTYSAKELVILDGGSTDGTLNKLEAYRQYFAYYASGKDNGIYDAMNKGIAAAKGEWLYFLGADDVLFNPDVLTDIFTQKEISDYDFVYGNVRFKSNHVVFGGSRTYSQLIGKNINHQAIFYRKGIFNKIGNYNIKYKVLADYDLNLRVFRDEEILKKYMAIDVCLFNNKGGTSNVTIDRPFFADHLLYFINKGKLSAGDPLLQQYYFYTGFLLLFFDKKISGLNYCLRAFTSGPRKIFYILVFIKYTLGYFGIGRKIKVV